MRKHSFHIGGIHSNYKFGLPTPRTSRQAFGSDFDRNQAADHLVFVVVLVCSAVGLLIVGF